MDEQKSKKVNEINIIKRELDKNGIAYDKLSPKAKQLLIQSERFLEIQKDTLKRNIQEINRTKYDVQSFCAYQGIARATIYKKNKNGINQYSDVIKYINSRYGNFEAFKTKMISDMYKEKNEDAQLLNKLLLHEAEYIFMQEKLEEQNHTIKNLNEEINSLKKLYGNKNQTIN